MTEGSAKQEPAEIPDRLVTINQVVAWNMAFFRRAAGMTQAQLGARLGWSFRAVSAAERTAARTDLKGRLFDAQILAELAVALGVPLLALFLPPEDDGIRERYVFPAVAGDDCLEGDMGDLLALAMPDSDDESPVMDAYRDRLRASVIRYRDPSWEEDVARWLRMADTDAIRDEEIAVLRTERDGMLRAAALLGRIADAVEKAGGA